MDSQLKKPSTNSVGNWTPQEDEVILRYVYEKGKGDEHMMWGNLSETLNGRSGKSCRERWFNHLDPKIKRTEWSQEEQWVLFILRNQNSEKWSLISKRLMGRTDNAVKNYWNSRLKKRIDSMQHAVNQHFERKRKQKIQLMTSNIAQTEPQQADLQALAGDQNVDQTNLLTKEQKDELTAYMERIKSEYLQKILDQVNHQNIEYFENLACEYTLQLQTAKLDPLAFSKGSFGASPSEPPKLDLSSNKSSKKKNDIGEFSIKNDPLQVYDHQSFIKNPEVIQMHLDILYKSIGFLSKHKIDRILDEYKRAKEQKKREEEERLRLQRQMKKSRGRQSKKDQCKGADENAEDQQNCKNSQSNTIYNQIGQNGKDINQADISFASPDQANKNGHAYNISGEDGNPAFDSNCNQLPGFQQNDGASPLGAKGGSPMNCLPFSSLNDSLVAAQKGPNGENREISGTESSQASGFTFDSHPSRHSRGSQLLNCSKRSKQSRALRRILRKMRKQRRLARKIDKIFVSTKEQRSLAGDNNHDPLMLKTQQVPQQHSNGIVAQIQPVDQELTVTENATESLSKEVSIHQALPNSNGCMMEPPLEVATGKGGKVNLRKSTQAGKSLRASAGFGRKSLNLKSKGIRKNKSPPKTHSPHDEKAETASNFGKVSNDGNTTNIINQVQNNNNNYNQNYNITYNNVENITQNFYIKLDRNGNPQRHPYPPQQPQQQPNQKQQTPYQQPGFDTTKPKQAGMSPDPSFGNLHPQKQQTMQQSPQEQYIEPQIETRLSMQKAHSAQVNANVYHERDRSAHIEEYRQDFIIKPNPEGHSIHHLQQQQEFYGSNGGPMSSMPRQDRMYPHMHPMQYSSPLRQSPIRHRRARGSHSRGGRSRTRSRTRSTKGRQYSTQNFLDQTMTQIVQGKDRELNPLVSHEKRMAPSRRDPYAHHQDYHGQLAPHGQYGPGDKMQPYHPHMGNHPPMRGHPAHYYHQPVSYFEDQAPVQLTEEEISRMHDQHVQMCSPHCHHHHQYMPGHHQEHHQHHDGQYGHQYHQNQHHQKQMHASPGGYSDYDRQTQDSTPFAQKVGALYQSPVRYEAHQSSHMMHHTSESRTYTRNEMHHSTYVNPFFNSPATNDRDRSGNSNGPACSSPQFSKQKGNENYHHQTTMHQSQSAVHLRSSGQHPNPFSASPRNFIGQNPSKGQAHSSFGFKVSSFNPDGFASKKPMMQASPTGLFAAKMDGSRGLSPQYQPDISNDILSKIKEPRGRAESGAFTERQAFAFKERSYHSSQGKGCDDGVTGWGFDGDSHTSAAQLAQVPGIEEAYAYK